MHFWIPLVGNNAGNSWSRHIIVYLSTNSTKLNQIKVIYKLKEINFFKKKLRLCHKLKFSFPYIFATWWCKPLIFQTYIIWSNGINSLKYLRSVTSSSKDKGIRKSEIEAKTKYFLLRILEKSHKLLSS